MKNFTSTIAGTIALAAVATYAVISGITFDPGIDDLERLSRLAESNDLVSKSGKKYSYGRMPKVIADSDLKPLDSDFGFDPELASRIYQRNLKFENLDPTAFPNTELGRAAREGLGHLITHGTSDVSAPLWTRAIEGGSLDKLRQRFVELGYTPSPFRAQLEAKARLHLTTTDRFGSSSNYTIDAPAPLALNESAYRTLDETSAGQHWNEYMADNCFTCHAGVYGDVVVGGTPNKNYNPVWAYKLSESVYEFVRLWDSDNAAAKKQLMANDLLEEIGVEISQEVLLDVDDYEVSHLINVLRYFENVQGTILSQASNETIGTNSSSFLPPAKVAHLKTKAKNYDDWESPDVAWSEGSTYQEFLKKYESDQGAEFAVTHPRPWWLGRYCGTHFWHHFVQSGVPKSSGPLAAFLMDPNHGNLHAPPWSERFKISVRLQSYIEMCQSPTFPENIDYAIAGRGMSLYNENCAQCHGEIEIDQNEQLSVNEGTQFVLNYDKESGRRAYDEVGTDALYWHHQAMAKNVFDMVTSVPDAENYEMHVTTPDPAKEPTITAPPLIGVWASAPYLHNGSVPNVYLVLNSQQRPDCWKTDADPSAFDFQKMGLVYEDAKSSSAKTKPLDWHIYDTSHTENGMTNGGHEFGDHLTDAERFEIIEFLKIMETRRVRPNVIED